MTSDEAALAVIQDVLEREGGIKDVGDGKGVTRFGQTPAWLAQFGFDPPDTPEKAAANYRTWLVRTRLIGVCAAPDSLADLVIDTGVHAGHSWAIRALQRALKVSADGVWGPGTQAAVDACDRRRTARGVLAARLREDGRLIEAKPEKYARFAHGWANRRAEQLERLD